MLVLIHAVFIPLFAADAVVNGERDHRLANAKNASLARISAREALLAA